MEYVLSVIGNPAGPPVSDAAVDWAAGSMRDAGAEIAAPDWLAPGIACDVRFSGLEPRAAMLAASQFMCGTPVDLVAQPLADRRKRLLIADMDSTIINCECIDELADFAGLKTKVAAITERAMRGELDFRAALRERTAMLHGLDAAVLERVFRERVRLNPGARQLVQTMRKHGAFTALVSGGFTYFTGRVRAAAGFDFDQANELLLLDGRLAGTVQEPILDAGAKLAALTNLAAARGLKRSETLAVGDGANDLPMLQAAGLGVAYHAKPMVAKAAEAVINRGDLTALLYLQGYRRAEFAD